MNLKSKNLCVAIYLMMLAFFIAPVLGVQKMSDDFYIGKIPGKELRGGKELWLAMERVTDDNIASWKKYIKIQTMPRGIGVAFARIDENGKAMQKGMLGDGSYHFKAVLDEVSYTENEIWIAYITKASLPQKIPAIPDFHPTWGYDPVYACENSNNLCKGGAFMANLEMFMTVTSSPNALVTSHMGIASSIEGTLSRRTKGTSVDLHSFAAKVMLERNPHRECMINAPVFAMEKIMIDALPNSVFVGTKEMEEIMKERQNVNEEEFARKESENIRLLLKSEAEKFLDSINQNLDLQLDWARRGLIKGHTEESIRKKHIGDLPTNSLVEMGEEGKYVISESKIEEALPKKIDEEFIQYKNPFHFSPEKNIRDRSASFLQLMEKCPPLLSVDGESIIRRSATIFNHNNPMHPCLTIIEGNRDYQWMFQSAFKPHASTHYMVVDLAALANSRVVEPTELNIEDFRD